MQNIDILRVKEDNNKFNSFRIAVPSDFDQVFSHFYFAENKTSETITRTLLPSYQTILIFNFEQKAWLSSTQNTQIEIDKCIVLGPIKHAFEYSLPPDSAILVANFKADAFYSFFGSASVAENLPIHPDELLDERCFTTLWNELAQINDVNLQINHILEFCRPYLKPRNAIIEQLTNFKEPNLNPIKAIASDNNQTERSIQLNHKKHLGYSAKEISRYQRFLQAIELIQSIASTSPKFDWVEIIHECGYYDQSQLIHDFKHYINLSPKKYLKFQQEICNPKL